MDFCFFRVVCVLFALLSHTIVTASPMDLNVDESTSNVTLEPYLSYFEDASSALTLNDVVLREGGWQQVGNKVPNLGFSNSTYWFRVSFNNTSDRVTEKFLQLTYPMLNEVHAFQIVDGSVVHDLKLGYSVPFSNRPIESRHLVFPIQMPPNKLTTLYFKVDSENTVLFPLILWEEREFWANDQIMMSYQALYFGLIGAMIMYNIFIAWGTKQKIYYLYVFFIASLALIQAINQGVAYQFIWRHYPVINNLSFAVVVPLASVVTVFFINEILQVKKNLPFHYFILKISMAITAMLVVTPFFIPYHISMQCTAAMVVIQSLIVSWICFSRWRRAEAEARVFVIAWLFLTLGTIVFPLGRFGVLEYNVLSEYALQFGSAAEIMLLSLVLVMRINRLRQENVSAKLESQEVMLRSRAEMEEGKARSQFLAMMSHEIRTPMNGVLGLVDVLKETSLDKKQTQLIGVIQNSGEMLLNIISDILDFSKADADSLKLEALPVSIEQVIDECVAVYAGVAKQKSVLLISHHDGNVPNLIECDPIRLKQVISNLLANAFKFTKSGHVFLSSKIIDRFDGKRIRFEIEDSGIGLSMTQQEKLFTPFTQANRSITREFGGTGLGLAISKKIVNLMGGEIGVYSEEGCGATFWFDMPIEGEGFVEVDLPKHLSVSHSKVMVCSDYFPLIDICERVFSRNNVEVISIGLPLSIQEDVAILSDDDVGIVYIAEKGQLMESLVSSAQSACTNTINGYYLIAGAAENTTSLDIKSFSDLKTSIELHKLIADYQDIAVEEKDKYASHDLPAEVKNLKVLVAEDNTINQMVIKGILSSMVSDIEIVNNGREAVDKIIQDKGYYDLVFMDCEMPVMDGYEAVINIREAERAENLPPLKVVALTAHALDEYRKKAFDSGMDDHLTKPINRKYMQAFFHKHYG